jgi:hypothetical protein
MNLAGSMFVFLKESKRKKITKEVAEEKFPSLKRLCFQGKMLL